MSIRKFLLINLLLAITVTTTLTAVGNYYLDQKDIQSHLDTLMALSTLSYQSLISHELNPTELNQVQDSLNRIPERLHRYYSGPQLSRLHERFYNQFIYQVWDGNKNLLLRSPTAPTIPLTAGEEGFIDKKIDHQKWRVFAAYDNSNKVTTVVAERSDNRDQLGHIIAEDDIYIMLLTFPLSGLLIWIIIGRGLSSVNTVAEEVANRAPSYLEPVDVKGVPSEIKPLIEELNKLFLRLQQAFEREKRFAADAAHELRTPLAALKTQAQVALITDNQDERKESLHKVITGVDRSTHIIQQLLTLSRLVPEAQHLDDATEINLSKLAAEIVAQLVPSAVAKEIEVELETDSQVITVFGNVTAISILIRNLVDNAIRYTPEGGKVVASVEEHGSYNIFRVTDNGPGIPAELRARVFERFFRVLGNKSPGSGLGLAIVSQIASLHNAHVKLGAPKSGKGLEVEVKFPKAEKR